MCDQKQEIVEVDLLHMYVLYQWLRDLIKFAAKTPVHGNRRIGASSLHSRRMWVLENIKSR
jgi:hypothetical protein